MDYQGGSPAGGYQKTGSGRSSTGGGARRSYDEQSITPVTIHMALGASDNDGTLTLEDGRPLYQVRIVAAVRSFTAASTNLLYKLEDGTGLVDVKQWMDDATDCSAVAELREATAQDNVYVKIVGQIKDYDNQKMIVADSIRPLSTGNEVAHHFLEVIHAAQSYQKRNAYIPGGVAPMSVSKPIASAAGNSTLRDQVLAYVREKGEMTEMGVSLQSLTTLGDGVRAVLDALTNDGLVYTTIDEEHFKCAY